MGRDQAQRQKLALTPRERALVAQTRLAALVIIGAFVLWMGAQWLGAALGLAPRYAFLFDFAALAAFAWSIIVLIRVWRARAHNEDG